MKIDIYNHQKRYENWKKEVVETGEEGLTKKNSDVLITYVFDMEIGANVSKSSKKGGRSYPRLNNIKQRLSQMMKMLQDREVKDITKITEKRLIEFFSDRRRGTIKTARGTDYRSTSDYINVMKSFWHWWMKTNRKKGEMIQDITEELETKHPERQFTYLSKEELLIRGYKEGIDFIHQFKFMNKFMCDFCFPNQKVIIEVNGDYWHANPSKYAGKKLHLQQRKGVNKDKAKEAYITKVDNSSWTFLSFWESDIKKDVVKCVDRIEEVLVKKKDLSKSSHN